MTSKPNIDATTLQQWILASLEKSQVKERLQSMGYHEKYTEELKKLTNRNDRIHFEKYQRYKNELHKM